MTWTMSGNACLMPSMFLLKNDAAWYDDLHVYSTGIRWSIYVQLPMPTFSEIS